MPRLMLTLSVMCVLVLGVGPAVAGQSPHPSFPPPGPPYPDPIAGVRVYDHAGVLSDDTITSVEATLGAIEERTGADIVVLTQVKPESDTPRAAMRDARALVDQWEVGQAADDAGLAILFDLEPNLCHGQVQLYATPGYAAAYLSNEERQAIFEQDMLPALRDCDMDAALLAAMERIDAATGQDRPSPAVESPPWLGGRVEMPEHGFAVTLPDDWVAFDLGADVVGQFESLRRSLGVMPDEELSYTQETLTQAAIDGMQLVAIDGSEGGLCLFRVLTGRSWELDDFTDAFYQDRLSQDSVTDVEPPTPIELPAGPGRVLAMRGQDPDNADLWAPMTVYLIQADGDILVVVCTGPERPGDDYLSIAEGVEFLPAVAEADPVPMPTMLLSARDANAASSWLDPVGPIIDGGRVEQAAYGFAITFPDDWTVRQVTPAGARALWGAEGVPDGRSLVLAAEHTLRDGYCFVEFEDPSVWNGPVLLAAYAAAMESQWLEDPAYGDEERTRVDLPVGPAWRIDASFNTRSESWYLVRGADGIHRVGCASSDPPEDRWLSIAETFEFLPDPASGSMPSSPVLGGGRIERPVEGFAVTFPDDWTVEEVTPEIESALFPERDREGQALQTTILWADQPQSDGYCLVVDFTRLADEPPAWRSVRAATKGLWVHWRDDEELVGPEHVLQDFPLGRIGHLSAISVDGWTQDGYIYSNSALWMYLACWSPDPPEDRWLSIAETFEFLPAKE